MRKIGILVATLLTLGLSSISFAQQLASASSSVPQAIKYQAVARNSNGDAIANQAVSFRISIVQGSSTGTTVYEETQTATTNQFGLANLSIGNGTVVLGQFDVIDWGNGTYFVTIEFDPKGGEEYTLMGSSQLLSVPYSLYAEHAKTADNVTAFPVKAALLASNLQTPFDSPETGMLVYNTATSGLGTYSVSPGYYYNAGTAMDPNWIPLANSSNPKIGTTPAAACATSTSTTYGGILQDGNGSGAAANGVGAPTSANNTGFGYYVFGPCNSAQTTGLDNTGVGAFALASVTSGNYNTGIGTDALKLITKGSGNTSEGSGALESIGGNASNNTAIGWDVMQLSTTGNGSTAVGTYALYNNAASASTAVGDSALYKNTTGLHNTAIGYQALERNVKASMNTAVGYNTLINNTGDANTAIGDSALALNTTGTANIAIGQNTMQSNTTGNANVAIGNGSLASTTTASNNTAVGILSLDDDITGINNTAAGSNAMASYTTGSSNTALGANALYGQVWNSSASGSLNTATGDSAMFNNTTGRSNTANGYAAAALGTKATSVTAIGYKALYNNTVSWNTAIGDSALTSNTVGQYNTATGYQALTANTGYAVSDIRGGYYNTANGYRALYSNIGSTGTGGTDNGSNNTATGYQALYYNANNSSTPGGDGNTADGSGALANNTSGNGNTAVGQNALYANATGSNNTAIGYLASVGSGNLTNATAIGANATVSASNTIQLGSSSVVNVNIAGALSVPAQISSLTSGTIIANQGIQALVLTGGGSNTTVTINFPAAAVTGQIFILTGSTGFSSPTFVSTGNTFSSPPSSIVAGSSLRFILIGTVWYNI